MPARNPDLPLDASRIGGEIQVRSSHVVMNP